MTFKQTHQTITNSKVFQNFKQEHPNAELIIGFFIIDFISNDNKKTLDYRVDDKIFTFSLNSQDEITLKEDKLIETPEKPDLQKISEDIKIDLDEVKSIAEKSAVKNNIKSKFHKIIAVLQKNENKQFWNLTCMLDGLIILHILIDSNTREILKFEKKSMMDFIKKK